MSTCRCCEHPKLDTAPVESDGVDICDDCLNADCHDDPKGRCRFITVQETRKY